VKLPLRGYITRQQSLATWQFKSNKMAKYFLLLARAKIRFLLFICATAEAFRDEI
jgi:hypothetical protein